MKLITAALMTLLALELSGCGKRARYLDPPDGSPATQFPKRYPPQDEPGQRL